MKILIPDSSGLNPFLYSIREGELRTEDLEKFLETQEIKLYAAKEVCFDCNNAFRYSNKSDIFTQSFIENSVGCTGCTIGDNGTFVESMNKPALVTIVAATESSRTFEGWPSPKISKEDKSSIVLAKKLSGKYVAVLANDGNLRKHCGRLNVLVYGSASLLAGIVLTGFLTYQKGTCLYNSWYVKNHGWIPKNLTFGSVLKIERNRIEGNKSFFVNH